MAPPTSEEWGSGFEGGRGREIERRQRILNEVYEGFLRGPIHPPYIPSAPLRPSELVRTSLPDQSSNTTDQEIKKLKAQVEQANNRANAAERRVSDAERRAADAERRLRELTGGSSTTYRSTTPSSAPSFVTQSSSIPELLKKPERDYNYKTDLEYTCGKLNNDAFPDNPFSINDNVEQRMTFLKQNKSHIARLVNLVGSVYSSELGSPQITPFDERAYIKSRGVAAMVLPYDRGMVYVPAFWPIVPIPMYDQLLSLYNQLGNITSPLGFPRSFGGEIGLQPLRITDDASRMRFEFGEVIKSYGACHPIFGHIKSRLESASNGRYLDVGWVPSSSLVADGKLVSVTFENGKTFTA